MQSKQSVQTKQSTQPKIIDPEKTSVSKTVRNFGINFCIGFTALMILCMIAGLIFAEEEAKEGILYCWTLLGTMLVIAFLQLVFFTPTFIKRLSYGLRLFAFGICLYGLLIVLAIIFQWFPLNNFTAWISFTLTYLIILALMTLLFTGIYRRETKELNRNLEKFKSHNQN